jgi:hypothetical protein
MAEFDPDAYLRKKFDPDAYLKSRGVVLKQPTAAPPPPNPTRTWQDTLGAASKLIPQGVEQGVVGAATAIPTLAQMGEAGLEHFYPGVTKTIGDLGGNTGLLNPKYAYPAVQGQVERAAANVGQPFYQPKTPGEELLQMGTSFIPGMMSGGEGLLPRAAQTGGIMAGTMGAGELANAAQGTAAEKYVTPFRPAMEMAGALLGHKLAPRIGSPFPIRDADYAGEANTLNDKGIPLSAARKTGSPFLAQREANLGLGGDENTNFSRAVLNELGIPGARASADQLKTAQSGFQNNYENFFKGNSLNYGTIVPDFKKMATDYKRIAGPSDEIQKYVDRLVKGVSGKLPPSASAITAMPGPAYQVVREQMGNSIAGATGSEKQTLIAMRDRLDQAWKDSLPSDDARAAWDKLNSQYANWKVVTQGNLPVDKVITPDVLADSVEKVRGTQAFNLEQSTLAKMAHAGQSVLSDLPGKTVPGARLSAIAAPVGGAIGYTHGGSDPGIFGLLMGGAIPPAIGMASRNPLTRGAYQAASPLIANQTFAPKAPLSNQELFARALAGLTAQQGQPAPPPPQQTPQ